MLILEVKKRFGTIPSWQTKESLCLCENLNSLIRMITLTWKSCKHFPVFATQERSLYTKQAVLFCIKWHMWWKKKSLFGSCRFKNIKLQCSRKKNHIMTEEVKMKCSLKCRNVTFLPRKQKTFPHFSWGIIFLSDLQCFWIPVCDQEDSIIAKLKKKEERKQ